MLDPPQRTHGSIFLKCSPSGPKHQNFSESSSPKERQKASGGGPCAPRDLTPPGRPGESPQAQGAVHEGKREERRDPESDTPTTRRPLTTPATTMHHHERSPARAASPPSPPIGTRFRSTSDGRKPGGDGGLAARDLPLATSSRPHTHTDSRQYPTRVRPFRRRHPH